MKISVTYKLSDIKVHSKLVAASSNLDAEIRDALSKIGFKCWASGIEIDTGIRDLAFDTEEVKV